MPKSKKTPPSSPYPKLKKARRKPLAAALRSRLREGRYAFAELEDVLEAEPEEIVAALRALRAKARGMVRTATNLGRTVWWWEEPPKGEKKPRP